MKALFYPIKWISKSIYSRILNIHAKGVESQIDTLRYLIKNSNETSFARDHNFDNIADYYDFFCQVNIFDYESLKPYVDRLRKGEENVLWKGKPIYFAKTSGTTSGAKYIPITKDSIGHHIEAARNSLFAYVAETGNYQFFSKKMIFLQGSPELEEENEIKVGRLSGIVYHHVPAWLLRNRKPSYKVNCIEEWEAKLEAIVGETSDADMSILSGIPPWCVMYFERLLAKTKKTDLKSLYPALQLYIYGGVNYAPYKDKVSQLLGGNVDTIETYPASEGFFAYQDRQNEEGLLLNLNAGIFYEFVRIADIHAEKPKRVHLGGVELGVNYVLIVSTNAGLWAYNTGDTIKFVHLNPYRLVVTGRVKHFISAFGEHVIQEEVEYAISMAAEELNISIQEFTVAPFISEEKGQSFHEWFVEFGGQNNFDKKLIISKIDNLLQAKNSYYQDLRKGNILAMPRLTEIDKNGFKNYFMAFDKMGGQNKVQHLANDRVLADRLKNYVKNG